MTVSIFEVRMLMDSLMSPGLVMFGSRPRKSLGVVNLH
jgi:hypothetical protein